MTWMDWQVLALSALPLTELRATIPLAIAMGMEPLRVYVLAVIGNILPIVPILYLLEPISILLRRFPLIDKIFQKILNKTRSKGDRVQKYGALGLILFVSVPLPGTGAWTGAALAWLFGVNRFYSIISISIGVLIAGVIVLSASLGLFKLAVLVKEIEYLLLLAAFMFIIYYFYKKRRNIN